MVLKVFRWQPGVRERFDEYTVTVKEGMTVLDALVDAQRRLDPTLAFRYACRVGMCGSCAMVINGRERWACRTLVQGLGGDSIAVRPLYHFPLIRDLVVDMAPFAQKMIDAGASFVPADGPLAFAPVGRDSRERRRIDAAIECIGCGMCVSACSMVGHDERFAGPAAWNRVFTLQEDSRDAAHAERAAGLAHEDALVRCHAQANCTAVCPMEIAPMESILALRRRAAFGPALFARPGRRSGDEPSAGTRW